MTTLHDLKPVRKDLVFDLANEAGFDMSDWVSSAKNPLKIKANPKYCYSWSFVQLGKLVIMNLWWDAIHEKNGNLVQSGNYREDAEAYRGIKGKQQWFKRATASDQALQAAVRGNLSVRVIINAGVKRKRGDPGSAASKVIFRQLDPEPWTVTEYDWDTGSHAISRGAFPGRFVDQFLLEQQQKLVEHDRKERIRLDYRRDPLVREAALSRANGACELCGAAGFAMPSGKIYLETHHVMPLFEGGADILENVAALCANDHRRAHYGDDAAKIRAALLDRIRPT